MKVIEQSSEILTPINGLEILKNIEIAGRVCYKSESKITDKSCLKFVKNIIDRGHESVLEHQQLSIRFITSRSVSHELCRHRVGVAISQESQRYVSQKDECIFINPHFWIGDSGSHVSCKYLWLKSLERAEKDYQILIELGAKPEEARDVLPNATKTELIMTFNLRELRHVLKLRTSKAAHPQMRWLMIPLLNDLKNKIPIIFDDIEVE